MHDTGAKQGGGGGTEARRNSREARQAGSPGLRDRGAGQLRFIAAVLTIYARRNGRGFGRGFVRVGGYAGFLSWSEWWEVGFWVGLWFGGGERVVL